MAQPEVLQRSAPARRCAALLPLLAVLAAAAAAASEAPKADGILVRVAEDGGLTAAGGKTRPEDLAQHLRKALAAEPRAAGRVLLDVQRREADSVFLVELLDACKEAGAKEIGLLVTSVTPHAERGADAGKSVRPPAAPDVTLQLNGAGQPFFGEDWVPREHLASELRRRHGAAPQSRLLLEISPITAKDWAWYGEVEQVLRSAASVGFTTAVLSWPRKQDDSDAPGQPWKSFEVRLLPAGAPWPPDAVR